MLSSTCAIRARSLAGVKFLSRLLTALNLLPSTATSVSEAYAAAEQDEASAGRLDRRAVVAAEVGDCFEVGCQTAEQPHQLEVSLRFALQAPAGGNAVQVAVDVELQQGARMVGRTSGLRRDGPLEPEFRQVQQLDERFDDANGVALVNVVLNALRQQESLTSVQALNVACHHRESVAPSLRRLAQHLRFEYPRRQSSHTASVESGLARAGTDPELPLLNPCR
jgi:hypothetical protein